MRRYLGFPVLALGLALGVYTHCPWLFEPAHSIETLPDAADAANARNRASSALTPEPALSREAQTAQDAALPFSGPGPTVVRAVKVAANEDTSRPAQYVVSTAGDLPTLPWDAEVTSATAPVQHQRDITSAKPADASARYDLVREIQRELKRVGCYGGDIDGSWGAASKWALSDFMDRVNASLPIVEPDYILLSLIKGQSSNMCGATCPAGQSLVAGGRCVPTTIASQNAGIALPGNTQPFLAARSVASAPGQGETVWVTEMQPASDDGVTISARAPLPGRMAIGGPTAPEALASRYPQPEARPDTGETSVDGEMAIVETPPATRAREAGSRSKRDRSVRRSHGTRSVQSIFTHPLGRM